MATLLSPSSLGDFSIANYRFGHSIPERHSGARSLDESADPSFSIAQFLIAEQEKDMLRLSTAGSVDDGKSTLIGRLLYDSRNVYEDHVRSVTRVQGTARASIDFAQLTDGLRAEREQGITIDVAYRYFSTERRKFIIADTPGHEQYTRNMATGASTADLAIILLDASKGILTQSRRHVYITSLLGIRYLVAAVNKMDLVDFSPETFARIEAQFTALVRQLGGASVKAIPVSALGGDNVVERSANMPWYSGPTLLEHLESVPVARQFDGTGFRLPVQRVIRPRADYHLPNFRGFAGQIAAGSIHVGDRVVALPSGRSTRVASISTFDGNLEEASAPQSISLTLEDEFDISHGDLIAAAEHLPRAAARFTRRWSGSTGARSTAHEAISCSKHAAQTVSARVSAIDHRINIQTLAEEPAGSLAMNEIGVVEIGTVRPIFFDPYDQNRITGSFILIDPDTNATVAAGMIQDAVQHGVRPAVEENSGKAARIHLSGTLLATGASLASALEQALLDEGCAVVRTRVQDAALWRVLEGVGALTIVEAPQQPLNGQQPGVRFAAFRAGQPKLDLLRVPGSGEPAVTVSEILDALRGKGILLPREEGKHDA